MVEQNVRRHQAVTSPPRGEPTASPPQARIPPPPQVVDPGHILTHILGVFAPASSTRRLDTSGQLWYNTIVKTDRKGSIA